MIVMMSVAGLEVPSGLVTAGPKLLPGSMAGRITLHPRLAELGPSKVSFNTTGGRFAGRWITVSLLNGMLGGRVGAPRTFCPSGGSPVGGVVGFGGILKKRE